MPMHYTPGRYLGVVTAQGLEMSKNDNPMIVLDFKPTHRMEFDAEGTEIESPVDGIYERRARVTIVPGNEKSVEMAMKKLRHAGFQGDDFSELDLVGKSIHLTCEESNRDGKQFEDWQLPLPGLGGGTKEPPKPLDSASVRKLNALFGKSLKDGAKSSPKKAAKSEPKEPATVGADDEIPF